MRLKIAKASEEIYSGTLQLSPIADTRTYQDSPNSNYGTAGDLSISGYSYSGYPYGMRSYLKFDLSALMGATIISAKLKLYKSYVNTNGTNVQYSARRILQEWDEMTLTYNLAPTYSARYGGVYTFGNIDEWSEHDITSMVAEWAAGTYPNYGVCFTWEATGYRQNSGWRSSNYADELYRPYLEVEYEAEEVFPEGYAVYGPYNLSSALTYYESEVRCVYSLPPDTALQLYSAITESDAPPLVSQYIPIDNNGPVYPFDIGDSLVNKYLWLMVHMSSATLSSSPSVTDLSWWLEGQGELDIIKLTLDSVNRIKYPQGDITVQYSKITGRIFGEYFTPVEDFSVDFSPTVITPLFNPRVIEHDIVSLQVSSVLFEVNKTSVSNGSENSEISFTLTSELIHVDDLET